MDVLKCFFHPKEAIEGSVLHELGDDPLRRRTSNNALQLQHVGMIKLPQDPRFTEEHAPLSVRRPPAKGLHRHQHLPSAHWAITTTGHLAKLGWSGEETGHTGVNGSNTTLEIQEDLSSTCSDHLLDLEVSGIDLTGEFFHRLTGVFIGRRVHVILHSTWS